MYQCTSIPRFLSSTLLSFLFDVSSLKQNHRRKKGTIIIKSLLRILVSKIKGFWWDFWEGKAVLETEP